MRVIQLLTLIAVGLLATACPESGGNNYVGTDAGDAVEKGDGVGNEDAPSRDDAAKPDVPEGNDACTPACGANECGGDGCGGKCGSCNAGFECKQGICEPISGCADLDDCHPWVCDPATGQCADCDDDTQCAEAGDVCDEDSGECVDCAGAGDCEDGFDCVDNKCDELVCPAIPCPEGTVCDETQGMCVACLEDTDCPPFHDCIDLECIAPPVCQSSKDCPDDLICDKDNGYCVECLVDVDCEDGYRCTELECVEILFCTSDKDCKEYDKVCHKDIGECFDCLGDADCATDHFCNELACKADVCDQDAEWPACVDNSVGQCNENGSQFTILAQCVEGEFCQAAQCLPWVCPPDAVSCDGNIAFACNSTGSKYIWQMDCGEVEKVCSKGECLEPACKPGETVCQDPFTLVTCSEDGWEFISLPCGDGQYCNEAAIQCSPWLCTPGQELCDGAFSITCNQYGSDFIDPVDCSELDLFCVNGECTECEPACGGIACGPDGCGGQCGTCNEFQECAGNVCVPQSCSGPCTGHTVEAYLCALEMCYGANVIEADFFSPSGDAIASAWEAVSHFGSPENDLAPKWGNSYGLLATGPATGTAHTTDLQGGGPLSDPFAKDGYSTYDIVEFTVKLKAPLDAKGFSISYIFFSVEYEEYIGTSFNDKFYVILDAPETTSDNAEVINFAVCGNPNSYFDFEFDGQKWCYIAINNALSEPCSAPETNISGTGFECGPPDSAHGSSTGWLKTSWIIQGGEEFNLTFHIHDSSDGIFDSEVILDGFEWRYDSVIPGTTKL